MIKITKMSTDELIEQMRYYGTDPYYTDVWEQTLGEIKNRLKDSERPKGEWIDYTEDGYVECPFCHSATTCDGNKDELHFCFSCGADMRGADDE